MDSLSSASTTRAKMYLMMEASYLNLELLSLIYVWMEDLSLLRK